MKESTRRRRAILRIRRLDNRDERLYGPPLIRALTGWDLYLASQYAQLHTVAQLVKPPGMSPEEMTGHARETFRAVVGTPSIHVNRCTHERSCD